MLLQAIEEEKEKSEEDHRAMLDSLEAIRRNQEVALTRAQEIKQELNKTESVCNETMMSLWNECKPCLKQICNTYYARICSSGDGFAGEQLDEYLENTSPFSLWIQGDKIENLKDKFEKQDERLLQLEESFQAMEQSIDRIFRQSTRVYTKMHPLFKFPIGGRFSQDNSEPIVFPVLDPTNSSKGHLRKRSNEVEQRLKATLQNISKEADLMMQRLNLTTWKGNQNSSAENATSDDDMVCKELRKSSEGCLMLKDKCDKCKEMLIVDCSGKRSVEGTPQQQYKDALKMAENYTSQYETLLGTFQEKILNTSSLLDKVNQLHEPIAELTTKMPVKED
ncbi:hypothetical protein NDU88_010958 [Pleurodeles waltl]|uniref:Clusterin n=1 Tax=Pleurodeles waltl TaxID=8319 RepID=A0AAV7S249_PLEWA|nr:hypothetical protein NDU88_010958 [Pleurodeles waltl]